MKKLLILSLLSISLFTFSGMAFASDTVSIMAKENPTCIVNCAQTMSQGISQCAINN